ncbi:MAG: serine/threonine-protein kinase, partial [Acidobacteriota bacterium]
MADSLTRSDFVPFKVGPYEVTGVLGAGSMGEVYAARDLRLEREVALKRIQPERLDSETFRRFSREARAAAGLGHPAIVQIHDWLETDSGAWIVMERLVGQSLADRLGEGSIPELSTAVRWAERLADGLAAAHSAGVVHRDLQAGNVMLTPGGGVRILDFGLAKIALAQGARADRDGRPPSAAGLGA